MSDRRKDIRISPELLKSVTASRDIWHLRALAMAAMLDAVGHDPRYILEADKAMCLSLFCAAKEIPANELVRQIEDGLNRVVGNEQILN